MENVREVKNIKMKFYRLSRDTFQWDAILTKKKLHEVIAVIQGMEGFISDKELPLKMELIDAYEDIKLWEGETPFADVLTWSSDFTLGGNCPDYGALQIMSKQIKEVLENYKLPPHRFYPIHMKCKHVKETREDYFLFHMIGDNLVNGEEYIDFEKCTFKESIENDEDEKEAIKIHPEGTITNRTEFNDTRLGKSTKIVLGTYKDEYFGITQNNCFEFENEVYKENYDVLWGIPNVIYVSEEIKAEIEKLDTINVLFHEINHNVIRQFEYEQMKNEGLL